MSKKSIIFRLPAEQAEKLTLCCETQQVSQQQLLADLVTAYLQANIALTVTSRAGKRIVTVEGGQ